VPRSQRSPPVDDEDPDEDSPVEEPLPKTSSAPPHRGARSRPTRHGVKAWDAPPGTDPDGADDEEKVDDDPPEKEHVFFRARDSVWFEPLVALMIIVVLLVSLFAYTSNWPPVYVVESESMQHGYNDELGLINTGDLVLARQVPTSSIVPYVVGMQTGYSTYGEYGDVILYHPFGDTDGAPIIHRAILFLQYNANNDSYSATDLNGLACGASPNAVYNTSSHGGCGTVGIRGTLSLYNIGWQSVSIFLPLDPSVLGRHSGFVTMGDNNFDGGNGGEGVPDEGVGNLSTLVEPGWVIGVARGMIPWFGALKLALDGQATEVPPQSWQYMGITLVGLFLAALGLHLFFRAEGVEDERRKMKEEADEAAEESAPKPPKGRSRWRFWESDHGEEGPEDADGAPPPKKHHLRASSKKTDETRRSGRPVPKVGRSHTAPSDDEGEDEAL
jgi:signal peptidase